jgi:hypothetical protein
VLTEEQWSKIRRLAGPTRGDHGEGLFGQPGDRERVHPQATATVRLTSVPARSRPAAGGPLPGGQGPPQEPGPGSYAIGDRSEGLPPFRQQCGVSPCSVVPRGLLPVAIARTGRGYDRRASGHRLAANRNGRPSAGARQLRRMVTVGRACRRFVRACSRADVCEERGVLH